MGTHYDYRFLISRLIRTCREQTPEILRRLSGGKGKDATDIEEEEVSNARTLLEVGLEEGHNNTHSFQS